MTDAASLPDGPVSPPETGKQPGPSAVRVRRAWKILVWHAVISVILLGLLWFTWEKPPFRESFKNIATVVLVGLVALHALVWLGWNAPLPRRVRLGAVAAILLGAIGYAATIRGFEFTGDMRIILHHRWEPSSAERLAEYLKSSPAATAATPVESVVIRPEDMPTFRGANSAGVVVGPPLSQDWQTQPPPELWRHPCGAGYAQVVVVGPLAVTIEQRDEQEAVVCYDAATGAERWSYAYPAYFRETQGGPGPRATPTIHEGAVYALGAEGTLLRLALADGARVWERNILVDHKAPNAEYGMTSSPLIWHDLVIVNPGGPEGDGLAAYRQSDGSHVWSTPGARRFATEGGTNNRPGYSTPIIATLGGVEQVVCFDGDGLRGYLPADGTRLWEHAHRNFAGVNVAVPLLLSGDRIFISTSYSVGSEMLHVTRTAEAWKVEVVWKNRKMECKFTNPVQHDGYIYGLDEGILTCLDPATGKEQWKGGRYGHGQILLTNGQILVMCEDGHAALVNAAPTAWQEVTRFRIFADAKNWNPPALVDGRLYARNHHEIVCLDLRAATNPTLTAQR